MRRRIFLSLGVTLFVAGLVVLSIGLVGYFGGSSPSGSEAVSDYGPFPASIRDVPGLPVAVSYNQPPEAPTPTPPPVQLSAPLRLVIDSINVDAPVSTYGLDANGIPIVPTGSDAGSVVAWYDFSSLPGGGSNSVLAAHVTWNRAPAVFNDLDALKPGDTIKVVAEDGREFVYEVFANFPVDPADPASLKVMAPTETDTLTLITCGGSWVPDPSEQFGGSYSDRTIVQAHLVEANVALPAVPAAISQG